MTLPQMAEVLGRAAPDREGEAVSGDDAARGTPSVPRLPEEWA